MRTINKTHKYILTNLPDSVDLGFTCISSTASQSFYLDNPNDHPIQFQFQTQKFKVIPDKGQIGPKTKISFTVSFSPDLAEVVVATVILTIESEEPRVYKLSGIGKYPFLQLNTSKLNFEQLLIGKSITKEVTIKNQSEVTANFTIQKIIDDEFKENAFILDSQGGSIPSKSTFLIKVTYQPQITNVVSVVRFKLSCQGGNDLFFDCSGTASPFKIYLSDYSINFGEIKIGNQASKLLTIHNDSELPTSYQFFSDAGNIFSLSKNRGMVPAKGLERIIVNFTPRTTICYYERIFAVSRNHQILVLDMIGTCYDLLIKPIPLQQHHINNFRRRVIQGKLSEVDFKYMENSYIMKMNQMIGTQKDTEFQSGGFMQTSGVHIGNLQGEWSETQNQTVLHKEMMLEPRSEHRLIEFSEDCLDFGFCEAMLQSPTKEIELFNKLNCKLTVFWTIQSHPTMDDNEKLPVFLVYPETTSIKPKSSAKFQVMFRPTKNCYYYFQRIQFFAIKYNPKLTKKLIEDAQKLKMRQTLSNTMMDNLKLNTTIMQTQNMSRRHQNQNVSIVSQKQQEALEQMTSDEMIPTFSGNITCVGHAFGMNSQPYIPIIEFYPNNKLNFSPCSMADSVYQTTELHNKSDTPVYFKFSPEVTRTFKVFPHQGLISGKSFQLLVIEFVPKENRAYHQTLSCYLNHQLSNQMQLQCIGYCSSPSLELQNDVSRGSTLVKKQQNHIKKQKIKVHNQSRVSLEYDIIIPEKYATELYLEPSNGRIKPNETLFLDCSFIPYKKKEYRVKVPFQAKEVLDPQQKLIGYHQPCSGDPERPLSQREPIVINYNFEIFGAGGDGSLNIEPKLIDFVIVKVNFNKKVFATLHNHSSCTFYIELNLRQSNQDQNKYDPHLQQLIEKSFTLDINSGIIAANSKLDIGIMFNPYEVNDFDLVLDVVASEKNPKAPRGPNATHYKKITSQKCQLMIKAKGSYPLLKLVDVRNDAISVATLWENFQINKINLELSQDLNDDEQKFLKIEQLNFTEAQSLQKRLRAYDWNFGYLPSKPTVKSRKIVITIQNIGGTELEWQFKLPSDHQIDLEPWADPGEPSEEDTIEKAILERQIFQIKPKSGVIPSQGFKDIELIYTPSNLDDEPGFKKKDTKKINESHFLRVVLQILNGKPLVINLKGTTLAPLEGLLAVKRHKFVLPQTPVGLLQPVKYPVEIQNVGSSKVSYKTDIQELNEQGEPVNSQFNVFDIENPQGSLLPNEKQYLYCEFKPLEQKGYFFELVIEVSDIVKVIQEVQLQISGQGYTHHPVKLRENEIDEIPRQRSFVSSIGSKVFFSIEEIDFGEVLPLKSAHRMIILYNLSTEKKFNYDFGSSYFALSNNKPGLCCGDEFLIEPIQGELEPGSFIELKLTLTASSTPSVYEGECECAIVWDIKEINQKQINSTQQSQNSNISGVDKETLFLRIKKRSNLNVELVNSFRQPPPPIHNPMAHPFQQLLSQIISEVLTDSNTNSILKRIDNQPLLPLATYDIPAQEQEYQDENQVEEQDLRQHRDYRDFRTLFLEEEFLELTDLIMENTFFNIIQETTRKECDLLRISKTFVTPANK